ncbi:MAG TPA: hypothetical protein VKG86_01180 [Terracidiphilus sp.]|nr:hypothetical protein [Terracidiphilus sp.]
MANPIAKATIEVGEAKVTFEGPAEFVNAQVAKYTSTRSSKPQATTASSNIQSPLSLVVSERDLIEEKRPSGHLETVTVLAYALAQSGIDEFTEEDIRRAYLRAAVRPPKVVSQALRDAKNKCDYIEVGSKKGTYRLSHHGDRTVRFDLPR